MSDKPTNDGGPAFPCEGREDSGLHPNPGMSLRDHFAAHASESDITSMIPPDLDSRIEIIKSGYGLRQWARYKHADAMMKAREQ